MLAGVVAGYFLAREALRLLGFDPDTANHWTRLLFVMAEIAVALPMAVVVLVSFALGAVLGVLVMMPRWWRQRQAAQRVQAPPPATTNAAPPASTAQPPASPADLARHMTDPSITIPYLEP